MLPGNSTFNGYPSIKVIGNMSMGKMAALNTEN